MNDEDWFDTIPDERKQQKMTDKDLSDIAEALGLGWELLFIELGLVQPTIERVKASAGPSVDLQIFNVLTKWKQNYSKKATFVTIVKALWKVNTRCTINWDIVTEVVRGEPDDPDAGAHSRTKAQDVGTTCGTGGQQTYDNEFNGFATHPLHANQLKKSVDDTEDLEHLKAVVNFGKSVGRISTPFGSGTGFRVGERYVMTAHHVIARYLEGTGVTLDTTLNWKDVFIDFEYKEGAQSNDAEQYRFCRVIYDNPSLDVTVLQLELETGKLTPPPPVSTIIFHKDLEITFVGHNQGRNKKRDPKCFIVIPTEEEINKGNQFCIDKFRTRGYDGHLDEKFVCFHCTFEHGASGCPGIVFDNSGKPFVMIMLQKGYPTFYWNLTPDEQNYFSRGRTLEQGISMERIAFDMKETCGEVFNLVFGKH